MHGGIDRRSFLDEAARFAVGGVTAVMQLEQLTPKLLEAQEGPNDDARMVEEYGEYPSPKGYGTMRGFLAFAPDALFPLGGYPGDEDKAREQFGTLDQAETRQDFLAATGFLKARP